MFQLEFKEIFKNPFGIIIQRSTPRSRYFSIQSLSSGGFQVCLPTCPVPGTGVQETRSYRIAVRGYWYLVDP